MVLDEGKSPESVAKDLGLSRSTFFRWVRQARIDRGEAAKGELTSDERRRLLVLERENRQLKTERELLKTMGGLLQPSEMSEVKFLDFVDAEKAAVPSIIACCVA